MNNNRKLMMFESSPTPFRVQEVSRHYYTSSNRHEQSIDIYWPSPRTKGNHDDEPQGDKKSPILVLVMGSGWMGHAKWVYSMTNWWNAQGPTNICEHLGYTCITIRHSGGYFHIKPLTIHTILLCILFPSYVILWLTLWLLHFWLGQGAATFEDMIQDVATAFEFIDKNSKDLGIDDDCQFVVGGYSSGGHLAASYFNQQPALNKRFLGILYLSGVLSLDCYVMKWVAWVVFGTVKGLPSPMDTIDDSPIRNVPHLVIGCRHETFGIPIMDNAFRPSVYYEKAPGKDFRSRCVLLPSNHWFMLSSSSLISALRTRMPLVFTDSDSSKRMLHQQESTPERVASTCDSSDAASYLMLPRI